MNKYKVCGLMLKVLLLIGTPATASINSFLQDHQYNSLISIHDKYLKQAPSLIVVSISKQKMQLFEKGKLKTSYTISTSKKGPGQLINSRKTPIGLHKICEKIGDGIPHYGVFKSRQFTGFIWPKNTPRRLHMRDFIVTRILRLEGLEDGINKGTNSQGFLVDSKDRAIYIHGTTMEWKIGSPSTIGCIHMRSRDVMQLFEEVAVGTLVYITT